MPRGAGHERGGAKAVLGPVAATFSKAPVHNEAVSTASTLIYPSPVSPLWDPLWRPDLCSVAPEAPPFLG